MREVGRPEGLLDLPDLRNGILVAVRAELLALDLLELVAHLMQLVLGKSLFPGRENDRVLARGVVLVHEDEALHGAGERLGIAAADRTLAGNGEDIFGHLPAAVMLRLENVGVSYSGPACLSDGGEDVGFLELGIAGYLGV